MCVSITISYAIRSMFSLISQMLSRQYYSALCYSLHCVQTLFQLGFFQLVVQAGKGGQDIPLPKAPDSFDIVVYEYKPSLTEDLQKASLVISHGGELELFDVFDSCFLEQYK